MSRARVTPGSLQRSEWTRRWPERIPRELLVLGRLYRDAIHRLRAGRGPTHNPDIDWEKLYQRPSWEVSRGVLGLLSRDTAATATSLAESMDEAESDHCLRFFSEISEVRSITRNRFPRHWRSKRGDISSWNCPTSG
jgi:hypothetical protein